MEEMVGAKFFFLEANIDMDSVSHTKVTIREQRYKTRKIINPCSQFTPALQHFFIVGDCPRDLRDRRHCPIVIFQLCKLIK